MPNTDRHVGRPAEYKSPLGEYLFAGGRTAPELFFGAESGERLIDRAILERLVRAKAEAELPQAVQRDGFASGLLTKALNALPQLPATPAGYKIGGQVNDLATMSIKPAFAVRATAIGIYTLQGCHLAPIGWFEPIASTTPATSAAPAGPAASAPTEATRPITAALPVLPADHEPAAEMEQLRAKAIQRRAALLVTRELVCAAPDLSDHLENDPEERVVEILPDGDVLVTIQLRVSAAELSAQRDTAGRCWRRSRSILATSLG